MTVMTGSAVQDLVALAEIELCGELMIAAATAHEDRLSPDRIDELLDVRPGSGRDERREDRDRSGDRGGRGDRDPGDQGRGDRDREDQDRG